MSTQPVQAEILGQKHLAEVVETIPVADYGDGPRDRVVVDVDGSHWTVPEDDVGRVDQ